MPVDEDGSVVFVKGDDGPELPGYVSETCLADQLPQAAGAVHCDAVRLLDILRRTEVGKMIVSSAGGWARIPSALLLHSLRQRGTRLRHGEAVRLSWSTLPLAVALRDALRERLLEFPGIRSVWIAEAHWERAGVAQLLVHLAVGPEAAPDAVKRLMETLLSEDVTIGRDDPVVATTVLDPVTDGDRIGEIDALGLDTVRADHALRRIEVVSREYDAAPTARPAAQPAAQPAARPGSGAAAGVRRRWWRSP